MKLTHTLAAASHSAPLRDVLANVSATAGTLGTKLRTGFAAGVTQVQISRMQSVLNGMTDEQLASAGIARDDIPQHARALVTEEYDGL